MDLPRSTIGSLQDRARMRQEIDIMQSASRPQVGDGTAVPIQRTSPQQGRDLPLLLPQHEYNTDAGVMGGDDVEADFMEVANRLRLKDETTIPGQKASPQQDRDLPVPRPEYATRPGAIGRDDAEVDFYVSCKEGRLSEVMEYVEGHQPLNIVRQYGMEQASHSDHPAVVRYLLESGGTLHGNVFVHPDSDKKSKNKYQKDTSIFDGLDRTKDIIALLEVFLDAGWHPNKPWLSFESEGRSWLLPYIHSDNKLVINFLLEREPDLRLEFGGGTTTRALRTWDTEFLDLLLSHGADAALRTSLFTIVERHPWGIRTVNRTETGSTDRSVPFSQRRATAEWLLQHGVDVNGVDNMISMDSATFTSEWNDETALSLACGREDWEFAEWLLENGADPELVGGRALRGLERPFPYYGNIDPSKVREIIERVRARHGGKLPAEGGSRG